MIEFIKKYLNIVDVTHLIDKICYNCNKKIILDETSQDNIYFYQIHGLGKHDQKYICHKCYIPTTPTRSFTFIRCTSCFTYSK